MLFLRTLFFYELKSLERPHLRSQNLFSPVEIIDNRSDTSLFFKMLLLFANRYLEGSIFSQEKRNLMELK